MSEKARFHEMTKPIKFRRIKLLKQTLVLWCKAIRERIIYNFNYLLYKLNILKRYTYRDNVETVIPAPHEIKEKGVTTEYFGGTVKMNLISSNEVDVDYFYYPLKDGGKKATLFLKNRNETKLFVVSHLEYIHIKVGDLWYDVNHLPVFKVASLVKPKPVGFIEADFIESPSEPKVIEYDIFKIKTLHHKQILGYFSPNEISEEMYKYYYECSCREFENQLNSLTLADILK